MEYFCDLEQYARDIAFCVGERADRATRLRVADLHLDNLASRDRLHRRSGVHRQPGLFQHAQPFSARGVRLSPLPYPISSFLSGVFEMSSSFRISFKIRETHYPFRRPDIAESRRLQLPARFARLARRFAIVLVRESFPAATAATTTTAGARTAATSCFWTRLVHLKVASAQFFTVQPRDSFGSFIVIGHFDKAKAAGAASLSIHY